MLGRAVFLAVLYMVSLAGSLHGRAIPNLENDQDVYEPLMEEFVIQSLPLPVEYDLSVRLEGNNVYVLAPYELENLSKNQLLRLKRNVQQAISSLTSGEDSEEGYNVTLLEDYLDQVLRFLEV